MFIFMGVYVAWLMLIQTKVNAVIKFYMFTLEKLIFRGKKTPSKYIGVGLSSRLELPLTAPH